MAHYRLYFLSNDHIRHALDLECESDEQAIAKVQEHGDGRAMELWRGLECIGRFPATPRSD